MSTTVFTDYYKNISSGVINPANVNFSAYIVDDTYTPVETHKKSQITGKIETLVKVLIGGDISTLTMAEIIEKVKSKLEPDELEKAKAFVVYDIGSQELAFYEEF